MTNPALEAIRAYSTCQVANAIETFNVRQRNQGFAGPGSRWMFPALPPMLGFAYTARIKTLQSPPMTRGYLDRTDWWRDIKDVPGPLIAVIEDVDESPGFGAVAGEVHSAIMQSLGCIGLATNGAVRDLPALERMGFAVYARGTSPSHSYAHILDHSKPVTISGLSIKPGDLLYVDLHGLVSIPPELVSQLPAEIDKQQTSDQRVIDLCRTANFSLERLQEEVRGSTS